MALLLFFACTEVALTVAVAVGLVSAMILIFSVFLNVNEPYFEATILMKKFIQKSSRDCFFITEGFKLRIFLKAPTP